jgi:putative ABC transport system permease protein
VTAWPAARAVAAHEWRTRRVALVAFGLLVGLAAGSLLAGTALARRTASAHDRLVAAVGAGDARVTVFGVPEVVDDVIGLPMVRRAWAGQISVGRVAGDGVVYVGIVAGEPRPADLLAPVIVAGRIPRDDRPDEVVLVEELARHLGIAPGDRLELILLTAEEVFRFDTGFGDPDGPTVVLEVVGIGRVPPGVLPGTPVLATPAFAAAHAPSAAGFDLHLDLTRGEHAVEPLREAVAELTGTMTPAPGAEEFPIAAVESPAREAQAASRSASVLVGGMSVALVVAVTVSLLALAQASQRHHRRSARAQAVESALGMTSNERATAHALPFLGPAVVAGVVAAGVGFAAAGWQPPGAVGRLEPAPGRLPDLVVLGVGGVATAAVVMAVAWLTARDPRWPNRIGSRPATSVPPWVPIRRGWMLAGATFALDRRARRVPVVSGLTAVALGLAGVVGATTFGANLDRLLDEPARYGGAADLTVADATDELVDALVGDERLVAVTELLSAPVRIQGRDAIAHAATPLRGAVGWTLVEGRSPAAGEVVLGTRLAAELDAVVGDTVELGTELVPVVGIGIGPAVSNEAFATSILVDPLTLGTVSAAQPFREVSVVAADDGSGADALAELGERYEVMARSLPGPVRDLGELRALPWVLGGFLAVLAASVLAHSLVSAVGARRADLAVLRALGSTRVEAAGAVAAMAITMLVVGAAVGVPLGVLVGRLVWFEVARATGVAGDVMIPVSALAAGAVIAIAAVLAAAGPAVRAARLGIATVLRSE